MQETKLTLEESAKLNSFIGDCIRKNVAFPFKQHVIGYKGTVGIQEVYNGSINDIRTFGEILYKTNLDNGSPFSSKAKALLIDNKVPISEVIENLQLIIQEKEYIAEQRKVAQRIASLETKLEGLKSESEVKSDILEELRKLKGEPEAVSAPVEPAKEPS